MGAQTSTQGQPQALVAFPGILTAHNLPIHTFYFVGTKIMATLGPSVHDVDTLSQMLEAGMVAGRVDLTWGPIEFHKNSLRYLEVGAGAVVGWGMSGIGHWVNAQV